MATRPWKRGTAAERAGNNLVAGAGELGVETDTGNMVVGDGVTFWSALKRLVRFDEVTTAVQNYVTSLVITNGSILTLAAETGYVYVIVDAAGRTALGITPDGTVKGKFQLPDGSITFAQLSDIVKASLAEPIPVESGTAQTVVDSGGHVLGGIRPDGSYFGKGFGSVGGALTLNTSWIITSARDASGNPQLRSVNRTTGQVTVLTTTGRNVDPVLDSANNVIFRSNTGEYPDKFSPRYVPAAGGTIWPVFSQSSKFFCTGDSLTAGTGSSDTDRRSYPAVLATMVGKQVRNEGHGGQTSEQIAAVNGGTPALGVFSGNSIPGSTTPVSVTVSVDFLNSAAGYFNNVGVTIAGVHGSLVGGASNIYTWTRTTAGSAVAISGSGAPIITDLSVENAPYIWCIWAGRNSFVALNTAAQIVAFDQSMVAAMKAYQKYFVILSVPPSSGETTGTSTRIKLDAVNALKQSTFPDNYLDVAAFLRTDDAFTMVGLTKTSQDITDMGNGVTPVSFRATGDSIHLNDYGYQIVATLVYNFIVSKGWLL